jgi:hypothetical protein
VRPDVLDRNAGAMRQLADEAQRRGFVLELTVLGGIRKDLRFSGRLVLEVGTAQQDLIATAQVTDAAELHLAADQCLAQLRSIP